MKLGYHPEHQCCLQLTLREGTVTLGVLGILFGFYQLADSKGKVVPISYGVVCIISYSIVWIGSMKNSRRLILFSLIFGSLAIFAGMIIGVYFTVAKDKFSWPYFISGLINVAFLIGVYHYYKELIGLEEGVRCHQIWMLLIYDVYDK